MARPRALGRGLGAILPAADEQTDKRSATDPTTLPIELLLPNPKQPRSRINEEGLVSLAESIREHGVVQPVLVAREGEKYRIVAGERRWRAATMAGCIDIPVRIVEGDDRNLREIALIENLQREDLSVIETARALSALIRDHQLTQETLASRIGWSRSRVTNTIRLLNLSDRIQDMLEDGNLTEGHARLLIGMETDEAERIALEVQTRALSVRDLEEYIRSMNEEPATADHSGDTGTEAPRRVPSKRVRLPERFEKASRQWGASVKARRTGESLSLTIKSIDQERFAALCAILEANAEEIFPGK
jgi:ParB family chromosome partitioning protein